MDHHLFQLLELLTIFLGGTAALLRFWPQFRSIAIMVQVAWFLVQMFNGYIKNHPEKIKRTKILISRMANHYFKTHPEGQRIADTTNIDERIEEYLGKIDKR